jgi:hypothetical protein
VTAHEKMLRQKLGIGPDEAHDCAERAKFSRSQLLRMKHLFDRG